MIQQEEEQLQLTRLQLWMSLEVQDELRQLCCIFILQLAEVMLLQPAPPAAPPHPKPWVPQG